MRRKYKIRHAILKHLYGKITYNEIDVPILQETKTSLKNLSASIGYPYNEVYIQHHMLPDTQAKCIPDNKEHYIVLMKEGIESVIDEYWLREGRKELNERFYDTTKWLAPVIIIIISASTLLFTIKKITALEQRVSTLQKEMEILKAQKK